MGTEDIRIGGGQLTVDRPANKPQINVDLSAVEKVYFERSPDPSGDAALVLTTRDGVDHLIRVSNEDDDKVLSRVYEGVRNARKGTRSREDTTAARE